MKIHLLIIAICLFTNLQAKVHFTSDSKVISDPYNLTNNPKRVPGATIRHYFHIKNDSDKTLINSKISTTIELSLFNIPNLKIDNLQIDRNSGKIIISLNEIKAQKTTSFYFDLILK